MKKRDYIVLPRVLGLIIEARSGEVAGVIDGTGMLPRDVIGALADVFGQAVTASVLEEAENELIAELEEGSEELLDPREALEESRDALEDSRKALEERREALEERRQALEERRQSLERMYLLPPHDAEADRSGDQGA